MGTGFACKQCNRRKVKCQPADASANAAVPRPLKEVPVPPTLKPQVKAPRKRARAASVDHGDANDGSDHAAPVPVASTSGTQAEEPTHATARDSVEREAKRPRTTRQSGNGAQSPVLNTPSTLTAMLACVLEKIEGLEGANKALIEKINCLEARVGVSCMMTETFRLAMNQVMTSQREVVDALRILADVGSPTVDAEARLGSESQVLGMVDNQDTSEDVVQPLTMSLSRASLEPRQEQGPPQRAREHGLPGDANAEHHVMLM